jgi:putative ABC transport system permease protein
MSWWMFALAGGLTMLVALLTVGWQAIRAATANPVTSLRYE